MTVSNTRLFTLNVVLLVLRRRRMAPNIADQPLHWIWHYRSLRASLDATLQRGTALSRMRSVVVGMQTVRGDAADGGWAGDGCFGWGGG
jgi:hypothetical protein